MFYKLKGLSTFQPLLFSSQKQLKTSQPFFTRMRISLGLATGFTYLAYRQGQDRYKQMHFAHMYERMPDTQVLTQQYFGDYKDKKLTFFNRLLLNLRRWVRGFYLLFKFLPLGLTFPIAWLFEKQLYDYWLRFMIYTLQTAGPLWIKLGQWASHRGDIVGEKMTRALEKLRDSAAPHQMKDTHKAFEAEFGKKIYDVFEFFNEQPVASGSIAQIYKARLNGQIVAVKVRHPNIIQELELDIKIWYTLAQLLGKGLVKQAAMPLTFDEFKRALVSQTDLIFEGRNLQVFNEKFAKNPNVLFPMPIEPYISKSVLVETWEEGIPLTKFLNQKRTRDHLTLANLGLKAFYKMLIYDNFIHADCHAGNMFVRISPRRIKYDEMDFKQKCIFRLENLQDGIYSLIEETIGYVMNKWVEWQMGQKKEVNEIKLLQNEQKSDENSFARFLKQNVADTNEVKVIFLDPGMVTILNKTDRINFIKLVMYVSLRKPIECGNLMLNLAQYHTDREIDEKTKAKFIKEIEEIFTVVCAVPLSQMNIGLVLRGILEKLRANDMAIEGHFAALLTNLIVLEGIAKELDPQINIVAKAASFLLHLKTIDKTIDEIVQQTL